MKNICFTLTAIIICACTFSCRKMSTPENIPTDNTALFKTVVQSWHQQFAKSASTKELHAAASIVEQLDYINTAKIVMQDAATLFLIRIADDRTPANNKYLGVLSTGNGYVLDGVYEAANMKQIEDFYQTKKLPAHQSIHVWGITGIPIRGWEATNTENILYKKGKGVNQTNPTSLSEQSRTLNSKQKLHLSLPPEEQSDPCIHWYWTIYNIQTGEVVSETYVYSTGDCDASGSGGAPLTSGEVGCNMSNTEAKAILAGISGFITSDDPNEISYLAGAEIAQSSGQTRRPQNTEWRFTKINVYGGLIGYTANFTGSVIRLANSNVWKWETFAYANTVHSSGVINSCVKLITSTTCSTTIDADGSKAKADIAFTWEGVVSCMTGNVRSNSPTTIYGFNLFYP